MSSFQVVPSAVTDTASRLSGISGHVQEIHGRLGICHGAASGTPAAGAMDGLVARWGAVLPQFARSAETLTAAVSAAATDYAGTDGAVAEAAR
jgi:uncharacterized protein YukE